MPDDHSKISQHLLDAARRQGGHDADHAVDWWAPDTIGGRATGDISRTARHVLGDIDRRPAILDTPAPPQHDGFTGTVLVRRIAYVCERAQ